MSEQELGHEKYQESYHRRSQLEIHLELLRAVKKGVMKPTRIMYAVNMSWTQLQKVLSALISKGFITEIESKRDKRTTRHYDITQRGLNVLNYLDKENDLLRLIEATHSA